MTSLVFMAFVSSAALIVEALIRSAGFHLPLLACVVFYFAYVRGSTAGFLLALIFGLLIDGVFGFTVPFSVLTVALAVPVAWLLLHGTGSESPLIMMSAGALFPLIVTLPGILFRSGWQTAFELLPHLFLAAVLTALLLPGIVALLDACAGKLGLPIFCEIKEKRNHAHE